PGAAAGGPLRVAPRAVLVVVLSVPVGAPLEDVAVQVIEAPAVGPVRAHRGRPPQALPPGGAPVGLGAVEVGLPGGQRPAEAERVGGAGAAGILPLGLRGQPIDPTRLPLLRPRR